MLEMMGLIMCLTFFLFGCGLIAVGIDDFNETSPGQRLFMKTLCLASGVIVWIIFIYAIVVR